MSARRIFLTLALAPSALLVGCCMLLLVIVVLEQLWQWVTGDYPPDPDRRPGW